MTWTAEKLYQAILDFIAMTPKRNEWSEEMLSYNKPRLIRFRQINSLLAAFQLTRTENQKNSFWTNVLNKKKERESDLTNNEIQPFIRGEFIDRRDIDNYAHLHSLFEEYSKQSETKYDLGDIRWLFGQLFTYRIKSESVLGFNSVAMGASQGFQVSVNLIGKSNKAIREQVELIDKIIIQIIDPFNKEFEEEQLIEEFDFPKDDLQEIDFANY